MFIDFRNHVACVFLLLRIEERQEFMKNLFVLRKPRRKIFLSYLKNVIGMNLLNYDKPKLAENPRFCQKKY